MERYDYQNKRLLQSSPQPDFWLPYYGRGLLENYSDRNIASFIGIYKNNVSGFGFDYIRPQENGNRTDVRWATLANQDGFGLKIKGKQPLNIKAAHNTWKIWISVLRRKTRIQAILHQEKLYS